MYSHNLPSPHTDNLDYKAEKLALAAESFEAFGSFKLAHVKRELNQFLKHFGRNSIFSQYTAHDISHINEMLRLTEWLVPEPTASHMTPADWLLIVLSIYFHDAAMVVTESEYNLRYSSRFKEYRLALLAKDDPQSKDFQARLRKMSANEAERFLYQEYVRENHAKRIRSWIDQDKHTNDGLPDAASRQIFSDWLTGLPAAFRRDLALVCESHHLDDLSDLEKYGISQPYGRTELEQANVQYAALILRTVDLIHMTSDRTPSVAFHLITPSDPISQREWAKQRAVRNVRAKSQRNKEGELDSTILPDTIEVHALFDNAQGFFALGSFLNYVRDQIGKSHAWAKTANQRGASNYLFPWKRIDDSRVEARGFLSKQYEFTLDQSKILDLLTGHTLYNDTSVAIRELIQNSIDAVRVQAVTSKTRGVVTVSWNSQLQVLTVSDNGTGMTQETIENHLLKVGSSRYQETDFKKKHPNFSPISRFGIGILSCFMIADDVEIYTVHEEEEEARHITLQSVHGRYLVRLLDKAQDADTKPIYPHGTIVKLKVRPSVKLGDIRSTIEQWVVVPECKVLFSLNDGPEEEIGYPTPAAALKHEIERLEQVVIIDDDSSPEDQQVRIEEHSVDGLSLAFAVRWSSWFKEWSFCTPYAFDRSVDDERRAPRLGVCIEGIRVTLETPGFQGFPIYAIANIRGRSSPRTNVARDGFEAGVEYDAAVRSFYHLYLDRIKHEFEALQQQQGFSVSWAARATRYLLSPIVSYFQRLSSRRGAPVIAPLFVQELAQIPLVVVERNDTREVISVASLLSEPAFWTIDSMFFRYAESLVEEASENGSVAAVLRAIGTRLKLPTEPILFSTKELRSLGLHLFANLEADSIVVDRHSRRVDLRWVRNNGGTDSRWTRLKRFTTTVPRLDFSVGARRMSRENARDQDYIVAGESVSFIGFESEIGVRTWDSVMLRGDTELGQFLSDLIHKANSTTDHEMRTVAVACIDILDATSHLAQKLKGTSLSVRDTVDAARAHLRLSTSASDILDHFLELLWSSDARIFDPSRWSREDNYRAW